MRIVITGASGMVGRASVDHFIARGHEVIALTREKILTSNQTIGHITTHVTDYSLPNLKQIIHGADTILHLSAMRPNTQADKIGYKAYYKANVQLTENLIKAAIEEKINSILFASSISVYSPPNKIPYLENEYAVPLNFYGASKLACEHLLSIYAQKAKFQWFSFRIAQIIGYDENRNNAMLTKFMALARCKESLPLWGSGSGARDTVYIKDVISAFECALNSESVSGIFNIGGGKAFSNREIAESINSVFENEGNLFFVPDQDEDIRCFYMDCTHAETKLGWSRKWTLQSGFKDLRSQQLSGKRVTRL